MDGANLRLLAVGLVLSLSMGCATWGPTLLSSPTDQSAQTATPATPVELQQASAVVPIYFLDAAPELSLSPLIDQVLARNPGLTQMQAAWQAASARFPQSTSLEDPMVAGSVAPLSIGSRDVDFGYRFEISQKLPYPGKLELRGQSAQAEARAAGRDVEDMKLQLIESTKVAYFEYFLIARALEVNAEAIKLLQEFRSNADSRYRTGQVPQQDVLQAEVEIGRQRERQLNIERMQEEAIGRINTLLNRPVLTALPPAPKEMPAPAPAPALETLVERAQSQRPDLQALAERIAADQAALALMHKEYYPDFEVMAAYDAFWQRPEDDLRAMLGVRMNLPIRQQRRHAAVAEVEARLAQKRAELEKLRSQVRLQVQEAHARLRESEKTARLYRETMLPAATANVKAAQSAYATGKTPFLSLIEAQRGLVALRDRSYEITTDLHRRRAALDRAVGGAPE